MLKFNLSQFRKRIYFKSKPTFFDMFTLNEFIQSSYKGKLFGFNRSGKYTKLINLQISEEEIFKNFKKNTRYDIRKSNEDGSVFSINSDINSFIKYYNVFAKQKGLSILTADSFGFDKLDKNILITNITKDDKVLSMHLYMVDNKINRVRLWYSASIFREYEKEDINRNIIARANKNLHFYDMKYFKSKGFLLYDFGGYAYKTTSSDLIGINSFKDQFGGILVEESNYSTIVYTILKNIKTNLTINKN
jgi:hypothetical protein